MAGLLWSPWIGIHASYMLGAKNGRTGLYLAMVTRSNGPTLTNTSEWKLSWQDAEAGKVPNHWNAGCRHASHESNRPTTSLDCVNLARFREGSSLSLRRIGRYSYQSDPSGEQVVHHAPLELAIFGELGFQRGDLGIHVGEDRGDGVLFGKLGHRKLQRLYVSSVNG